MKSEKHKIELPGKNVNPPVICKKTRNKSPQANKFDFVPRGSTFQTLKNQVATVQFNSVEKKLAVTFFENARFEVYKWINYLRNLHSEIQNNPFIEVDSNCAHLVFRDSEGVEVATLKLKNLDILNHGVVLDKMASNQDSLRHYVTIAYDTEELVIPVDEPEDPMIRTLSTPEADNEWQTMETP